MTAITDPARYIEPDAIKDEVSLTVSARQLQRGDALLPKGQVAASFVSGPKWITVRDAAGKDIAKLPATAEEVAITRVQETKESYEARYRARRNTSLCESIRRSAAQAAVALQEFQANVTEYHSVDHWKLDVLLSAQAMDLVWRRFENTANNGDFTDAVDAAECFAEELRKALVGKYRHEALSRSTSVTSNLLDDVNRCAEASWLDALKWTF